MQGATVEPTGYGFVVRWGDSAADTVALVTVNRTRDADLYCHLCRKGWCEHVQEVVDQTDPRP